MSQLMDLYQINAYLEELVPERPPEMIAMEAYADKNNFPIIGPICGHLCYLITRMVKARNIFEMGSGYGYSTAWFAQGVLENGGGKVHHVVWDKDESQRARQHLEKLGYGSLVDYHVGEAIETLSLTPGNFDIIFNDIDKECYPDSLALIHDKLHPGGVLIIDNLLWYGRVLDENDHDPTTQGVRELTRLVTTDPGWISNVIPIRDGMLVAFRC